MAKPRLEIRNASKRFGPNLVLDGVSLSVAAGEVRGLVGQNGAGKSTLIKILCGFHSPGPDTEVLIDETPLKLPASPSDVRRAGLSFVHQNLALIDDMPIVDNVRVGVFDAPMMGPINRRHESRAVRETLARLRCDVDPDALVRDLGQAERALVAFARALQRPGPNPTEISALILDEPTASLPRDSVESIFAAARALAEDGTAIVFVSHRLEEILALTDSVSVLRDGRLVGTFPTNELTEETLIEHILGVSQTEELARLPAHESGGGFVSGRNIRGTTISVVNFDLRHSEILGITGLPGSGFEELPYLLAGAGAPTARENTHVGGEVRIDEVALDLATARPRDMIRAGVALVPGHRERYGMAGDLRVRENVTLNRLRRHLAHFMIDRKWESSEVDALIEEFNVVPRDQNRQMGSLSGGNQQKAVIGKWLRAEPRLLLLHEPLHGVDVAARRTIIRALEIAASRGVGIILASIEYADLAELCDRVLIFRDGTVVQEIAGLSLTKDTLVGFSYRSGTTG